MTLDLRDIEFTCFSGHGPGGQNRNKCMICIRAKHIPTGVVAVAASERSLRQNKALALAHLQAKLAKLQETQQQAEKQARHREKPSASFGNAIRTYRMVGKDSGVLDHETGTRYGLDLLTKGRLDELLNLRLRLRKEQ